MFIFIIFIITVAIVAGITAAINNHKDNKEWSKHIKASEARLRLEREGRM